MAELDKKIQKAQTDLVQSVLEAHEKKNQERVDMLVTNAIKQLKMSRFKPDQTTCISLTYLARIKPKVFAQSSAIKEVLKSLLRRDNGPASIKGKNDIVLPVLAANILLACCDGAEVRAIVLHKVEQWLGSSQKAADMIQHLMATVCMKCQNDKQTITTLIEMRQHWLLYLDENYEIYGSVPSDLCASVRSLLHSETNCELFVAYLRFLIKHDTDIEGLADDISKFIINRPLSFNSMLDNETSGVIIKRMILKIYIKLLSNLEHAAQDKETSTTKMETEQPEQAPEKVGEEQFSKVVVKVEKTEEDEKFNTFGNFKREVKPEVKMSEATINIETPASPEPQKKEEQNEETDDGRVYVKLSKCAKVVSVRKTTVEAIFILFAMEDAKADSLIEFEELLSYWIVSDRISLVAPIYEDPDLTLAYNLPNVLRQRLVLSADYIFVEFGLRNANPSQLLALLQLFGSSLTTINSILKRLESVCNQEYIKSEIKDPSYFCQLMQFYENMGAKGAKELCRFIEQPTS